MHIIERGHGEPLVIVPGIQGRWEWIGAAVDALAERYRVLTFSLGDEPTARCNMRAGMDGFADQIGAVLDGRGLRRASLCGISFGGLVALRFAARDPERTSSLVLVSAPGPRWHLKPRHDFFARHPLVFGPLFLVEAAMRLQRELSAMPRDTVERRRFLGRYLGAVLSAPGSPKRMAARARLIAAHDRTADAAAITCPTLVMHGEATLDHVVDVGGTRDYLATIRHSREVTLADTGHLGFATRPREFARHVDDFLSGVARGSHDSAA